MKHTHSNSPLINRQVKILVNSGRSTQWILEKAWQLLYCSKLCLAQPIVPRIYGPFKMTPVFNIVIAFNFLLMTFFFIRLQAQLKSIKINAFYGREILVYYAFTFGYYTFKILLNGSENYFNFLNVFIPLFFTITWLFPDRKINTTNVTIFSGCGILIYNYPNKYLIVALYVLGILSIIQKSLFLAKQRGKIRTLAVVYIFLSLAQLLSFTQFMMHEIEFNWKNSMYLKYYCLLPSIIYPALTIVTHVKFRRLFLT
jgi:hypothetical protein